MQLPEQGQVVSVRKRTYSVTEVNKSVLIDQGNNESMHLVTLASLEDDALGEAMQIIWEREIGSYIIEETQLPTIGRFDSPIRLDAFLDAVRWGAASQADRAALQAPFRSGIQLQDYQLNPLVRALQMPRVSLLVADDVGLGKTVETGLIIQELISRNRARSVLVVCPAGLQLHWRDQMREKFGLEFRIVDSDSMRHLRRTRGIHVNPWTHFPRLITSVDFIKRNRPLLLLLNSVQEKPRYPRPFDILVVDEAHNIAPSSRGVYALDSQRTAAMRDIIPYFEHHLFLSATPHNGFPESFTALLELLDNQRFARGVPPDPRQLEAVMVRRLKRDLRDKLDRPIFHPRHIETLEVEYSDEEIHVHSQLRRYSELQRNRAQSRDAVYALEFVHRLLKKRLLSSPESFRRTLEQHIETISKPQKAKKDPASEQLGILRRQIAQTEEDYADDEEYEGANEVALEKATLDMFAPDEEGQHLLEEMLSWATNASERPDSKTNRLLEWLTATLRQDGIWNNERVILFTEYRTTQKWLQERLVGAGLGGDGRIELIYGGMDTEERERIKAAFQSAPSSNNSVRILLATDAASEGIDLQNFCHRLVHLEIPWNPNRLEQRNGRIDRMGQKHPPLIYHFVPKGYTDLGNNFSQGVPANELEGDLEFLMRAVQKVEQIREDLMGKVGDVIAQQVEEAMLGLRRRLDTATVEEKTRPARTLLKLERELDARIQKQIQAFYDQRHTLRLTPEHVKKVVEVALEIAEQPPLQPAANMPGAYFVPSMRGSTWASAKQGLSHPFTGEERPIVFDERLVQDDSVVLAHLNHPLVLLAQRLLRAEIWSPQGKLNRVTARIVPNHALNEPALVAYARLVVIGGGRYRLHEEIITAGGYLIYGNRPSFRRMNVGQLSTALEHATSAMPAESDFDSIIAHWEVFEPSLVSALEVRMKDRIGTITNQLEERKIKEIEDIEAILTELENAIRSELNTPEILQPYLPGMSPKENEQFERDVKALQARLERIPDEIGHEQQAIYARYEDIQSRLFPVAVTYLIPER